MTTKAILSRRWKPMSRSKYGKDNANFRDADRRICQQCGSVYRSYIKTRKYCDHKCYSASRTKVQAKVPKFELKSTGHMCRYCGDMIVNSDYRVKTCGSVDCRKKQLMKTHGPKPVTKCGYCGTAFIHHRTAKRKYCSYQCHLKSGGAQRAGEAAALVRHTHGAKKDQNHNELVDAMQKLGVGVIDMSNQGGGFPDLICCVRKDTLLVEIKNPKTRYGRKGLNDLQKKFAENWRGGPIYIVESLDDVELLANYELDSLYAYGGGGQMNVKNVSQADK